MTPSEAILKLDEMEATMREKLSGLSEEAGMVVTQWDGLVATGGGRDDHAALLLATLRPHMVGIRDFMDTCIDQLDGMSGSPFKDTDEAGDEFKE